MQELISPEQSNALTQTLYLKIRLRRLIQHTKLYAHTLFRCTHREGKSLMSSFQLSDGILHYRCVNKLIYNTYTKQ